jgi:hypothetical protein
MRLKKGIAVVGFLLSKFILYFKVVKQPSLRALSLGLTLIEPYGIKN